MSSFHTAPSIRELVFAGVLSRVADAVVTVDLAGQINYANQAALNLIQISADVLHGAALVTALSIVDVVTGETIRDALAELQDDYSQTPATRKALLLNSADTPIIIEYTLSTLRDGAEEAIGVAVIFRDITPRRNAEQALQSSEATSMAHATALFEEKERAQVTLNSIADAVVSTDFRGRITFLNNIATTMTGWSETEAVGRQLDEVFYLVDSDTRAHLSCPATQAIIEDRAIVPAAKTVLISRSGREVSIEARASPIHERAGGVAGAVMVAHDVSEAREETEKLTRLALRDALTGLPNRIVLVDRLNQAIELGQRYHKVLALLYIDLDRFKPVNDQLGHALGDELLQQVAERLIRCVRASDTVCRLGGDEFVILLTELAHETDPFTCAEKVSAAMSQPFALAEHVVEIGASVGVAVWPAAGHDADALLKAADAAMYRVKDTRPTPA